MLKSLGAAMALPALPAQSLMASAAPSAAVPTGLYAWGKMLAEVHGHCSTGMLTSMLKVEPKTALGLYEQLLANQVVAPANALGISRATNSLQAHLSPQAGGRVLKTTRVKLEKLEEQAEAFLDDDQDGAKDKDVVNDFAEDSPDVNHTGVSRPYDPDEPVPAENDSHIG